MHTHKLLTSGALIVLFMVLISSCVDMRKTTYFNDLQDGEAKSAPATIPAIHKNDILSISVSSLNPDASAVFNTPNLLPTSSSTILGATSQLILYFVNKKTHVLFPIFASQP